jgi:cysteine desulfurase/selenocysteine lyase
MSDTISTQQSRATRSDESLPLRKQVHSIRSDFPALDQIIAGNKLVYLDNAATSHKPLAVIDALRQFYIESNSNIHRGIHTLAERATEEFESARTEMQRLINAAQSKEIIFVRGVTEAANLVAYGFGRNRVSAGDEIIISEMEHHSSIVPWQVLCEERGASLRVIPINDDGDLLIDEFEKLLSPRTRLIAVTHVSNVLGTVNPIRRIVESAHHRNVPVFVDGAQSAPHMKIDVQETGCDFYAFSGHKLYGPTGIGVLYGRNKLLEEMQPYQTGGGAISTVTFNKTTYKAPPAKFEAGTPDIAGAIGLAAATKYVNALGFDRIAEYEHELVEYTVTKLSEVPRLRIIGNPKERSGIVSFVIEGAHAHDIATILDSYGIAIRAGHHCCQPLHERFGLAATARVSLAFYNLREEIDKLVDGIRRVLDVFNQ